MNVVIMLSNDLLHHRIFLFNVVPLFSFAFLIAESFEDNRKSVSQRVLPIFSIKYFYRFLSLNHFKIVFENKIKQWTSFIFFCMWIVNIPKLFVDKTFFASLNTLAIKYLSIDPGFTSCCSIIFHYSESLLLFWFHIQFEFISFIIDFKVKHTVLPIFLVASTI